MAHEDWDTLGKRVKGRRLALKMNQEQLAAAAGVGQGDISKIERGEIQQTTKIAHLARALQCDAYWLATGEGDAPADTPQSASVRDPLADLAPDLRQVIADLEDVPPQKRMRLIESVREAAAEAREAAAHLIARKRVKQHTPADDELFDDATKLVSRTAEEDARVARLRHEAENRQQNGGGRKEGP